MTGLTLNSPRAVIRPGHGTPAIIKSGDKAFDEPTLQAQAVFGEIPDILAGEPFVYTSLACGLGFTVKEAGRVLLLTEQRGETLHWLHPEFGLSTRFANRYRKIADFAQGTLLPAYDAALTLYELDCTAGMEFRAVIKPGQLCIVFANVSEDYIPITAADDDKNSLQLSTTPIIPMTGEEAIGKQGYTPDERGYQACPTIAVTANGTVYAAVMADPEGYTFLGGENHYCYIAIMRSKDGIVWEDPVTVFDPDGDGPARAFEPILWTSPDRKRLYLSYTQAAGTSSNIGGKIGTWITYTDNPENDTPIWAEPIRVIDGMADSRPFLASDGYWYWSTGFWASWHIRFFDENAPESASGIHIYRSKNCFDWEHICAVPNSNWAISEPTVIETVTGELMLIERRSGGTLVRTATLKDPKKWSPATHLRYDRNNEESPIMNMADSRNFLTKLPSGRLLLLYHDNDTRKRDRISAALSEDGGVTWPYRLLLDERLHSSYPFADVTDTGEILVIYDQGRVRPGGEILMARISEADIMAGKLISPKSVLKRLVNHYGMAPTEATVSCQEEAIKRICENCDATEQAALQSEIDRVQESPTTKQYQELCKLADRSAAFH